MRTLVDIGERQIKALDELAGRDQQSRAALIREAVDDYLAKRKPADAIERSAGLWGSRKIDGLEYERRLREEW